MPNYAKIGQSVAVISRFSCDFEDGGHRHLGFSKPRNVIGLYLVVGQLATTCQISLNSVERLLRYGDLAVFKMAAVRHLGFVRPYLDHPR